MFEVVPENNHYNLKTTPTPDRPPPPAPHSGETRLGAQKSQKAPKGAGFFELPATVPKQNLG
jgi:hypothetical protein